MKTVKKNVTTGMFVAPFPAWMKPELGMEIIISNAKLGNIDVLHCPLSILSQRVIDKFHNEGFIVHAADCDTELDIRSALNLGVDQLSTNNLELALNIKAQSSYIIRYEVGETSGLYRRD